MNQTQYEEEFRSSLHDAADGFGDLDIDLASVIHDGTRVVRRRRVAGATAGLAAAALVVAGGWAAISGLGKDNALPAGPSPSVTAPANAWTTVTLDNLVGQLDGTPASRVGPAKLAVSYNPHPVDEVNLRYEEVAADGTRTPINGATVDLAMHPLETSWTTAKNWNGRIIVGVMPKATREFQVITPVDPKGGHASTSTSADLPGTDLKAFAVFFAEPDASQVTDVVSWLQDGRVIDPTGEEVPAVQIRSGRDGSEASTVFLTGTSLGSFGSIGTSRIDLKDVSAGDYPALFQGRGGEQPSDPVTGLFALVVPAGAQNVTTTTSGMTPDSVPQVRTLGEHTLIAFGFTAKSAVPWHATVHWTDANGKAQTYTNR
jgi:hypothetical protein